MLYVKRGERVEAEARDLALAAHPGVVELVGVTEGVLQTRLVDGQSLAELSPLPADEVAGVAAAVGATLADLHDLGVVHGGVEASHVMVCADGRLVLCSLGRGGDPADDVAGLGRLVLDLLAASPPDDAGHSTRRGSPGRPRVVRPSRLGRSRWSRWAPPARLGAMLAPAAVPALTALASRAIDPDPSRRPSARAFAAAVHQGVPTARLPALRPRPLLPLTPPRPRATRFWRRPPAPGRLVLVTVVATVVGVAVVVLLRPGEPGMPERRRPARAATRTAVTDTTATTAEPVATRVWPAEPLSYSDGVLTVAGARYAVGLPGDVVVAGDWGCAGRRTVALLRPATGEVFTFDGWARPGEDLPARPLGRVAGGTALRAVDHDGDGCDDLEVERAGQPPTHLEARP